MAEADADQLGYNETVVQDVAARRMPWQGIHDKHGIHHQYAVGFDQIRERLATLADRYRATCQVVHVGIQRPTAFCPPVRPIRSGGQVR